MMKSTPVVIFFAALVVGVVAPPPTQTLRVDESIKLNDSNWRQSMQNEWLVKFHAPWCPACRNMEDHWNDIARQSKELGISVGSVDVTTDPGLSGRFFVTALPTIFHIKDSVIRQYRGARNAKAIRAMLDQRLWQDIEPTASFKHPDTIQMTVIAHFFDLSNYLKEWNDFFQEKYNFPSWMAYVVFAIGTILLGAVVGLMFVCVIDLVMPPKNTRKSFAEMKTNPHLPPPDEFCAREETNDSSETEEGEKFSGSDSEWEATDSAGGQLKSSDVEVEDEEERVDEELLEGGAGGDDKKKNKASPRPNQTSPDVRKRRTARKAD